MVVPTQSQQKYSTKSQTSQASQGASSWNWTSEEIVRWDAGAPSATQPPIQKPHQSPSQFEAYVKWLSKPSRGDGSEGAIAESTATQPVGASVVLPAYQPQSKTVASPLTLKNPLGADLTGRVFRVDPPEWSAQRAAPRPHLPVERIAQPETATDLTASMDTPKSQRESLLPGFLSHPATPLANWEVSDFRWPVSVERLIYQQPKHALLLLNKCTSFVRPNANRLIVCGNGRNQGASTIAIGLARWAAENAQRVLLVDADISRPGLADQLGLESGFDVSWDSGEPAISELLVQSNRTGVTLLPLKPRNGKLGSQAALDDLGAQIDPIALQFDLIVIDGGTANQVMNSLTQANQLADSLVLVHNRKDAEPESYMQTVARLNHFGIEKLVVAENFSGQSRRARA